MYPTDDTIAAIASAPVGAARGIVRVSGPRTLAILHACCGGNELAAITRPTAVSGALLLEAGYLLAADVYVWPGKRSYTREPAAEIHTIGSPPLLEAVLSALSTAGARVARPGEFTLRAFLAGRIDLTQAEAVLGVVDAQGDQQLQTALAQMAGGLAQPLALVRERLLSLLADLEAGLDFVEEDIEFVSRPQIADQLDEALRLVQRAADQLTTRRRSDELARVVLTGQPNVGKSSLFNALVQSGSALVSEIPGTTRDYLAAELDLGEFHCQLIDTAGHQSPTEAGEIGRLAGGLAAREASSSDVQLLCLDATRPANAWERKQLAANQDQRRLVVSTKCDLAPAGDWPPGAIATSAVTGAGLDELRRRLARLLVTSGPAESAVAVTAERCAESIRAARESLARAIELNAEAAGEELLAAEFRTALAELGKVVGAVYTDDILDRIFSRFCIGK